MGKLILVLGCLVSCGLHAEGIPQDHKDAIREHYEKLILGSGQDLTVRQPDVDLYRRIFTRPNVLDERPLPAPDEIPWPQLFKTSDLSLGEILRLAGAASGYEAEFDPAIDLSQAIRLNTASNSLRDLAEYLTRVSTAQVTVYPEARLLTVTRKVMPNG